MISAETLAQRLPVHAIIGPDLTVLQIGSALARVCGDVVGRSFDACFELVRPTLSVLDAPALRALINDSDERRLSEQIVCEARAQAERLSLPQTRSAIAAALA